MKSDDFTGVGLDKRQQRRRRRMLRSAEAKPTNPCPLCGADTYVCHERHADGGGPRIHCRQFSTHNFPLRKDV